MRINPTQNPFNQDNLTLQEIGLMLDLTKERVRQIEAKALAKACKILQSRHPTFQDLLRD